MKRLLTLLAAAAVFAASPAYADHCHYPPKPSHGKGSVDQSRVSDGECVTFTGNGFVPNSLIAITDNGTARPGVKTGRDGAFSSLLCFTAASKVGHHSLQARGPQAPPKGPPSDPPGHCSARSERMVSANVTVLGAQQGGVGSGNHGRGSGGQPDGVGSGALDRPLPRTGGFTGNEIAVGLLLTVLGGAVLLAGKPRRRRSEAPAQ